MKQKFFAMIAAAVLLMGTTGCSNEDSPSPIDINAMEKDLIGMWVDEYEYSDVTEDGVPFDKVLLCVGVHEDHTGCIYLGAFNKTSDEPVAFYEAGFNWELTKEGNIVLSDPDTDESTVLTRADGDSSYGNNMTNVSGTNMTYANGSVNVINSNYSGTLIRSAVYIVKYTPLKNARSRYLGYVVCTDGHIHRPGVNDFCNAEKVAKIIYVGSSTGDATYNHGLALALADEEGEMNWDTAISTCSAKNNTSAAVANASWMLASKDQWDYMLGSNGAGSYTALRDGFSSVGGTNLEKSYYWSSTEIDSYDARDYDFELGCWHSDSKNDGVIYVRACLAF